MHCKNETDFRECKGCSTINKCVTKPYYIDKQGVCECPCQTCLVKGICGQPCYYYYIYLSGYYRLLGKEGKLCYTTEQNRWFKKRKSEWNLVE